ncbi:MAG: hypothetical protein HRU20_16765 [Pseudomonadales bacterium]|nr:hypothetical protein [Pseudomonadales bacterium]
MTWVKKHQYVIAASLLFTFYVAILLFASQSAFTSYDSYWHLKTGDDLLHKGLSPFIDHYSFTFPGEAINYHSETFQVILSFFVSLFGLSGGYTLVRALACTLFLFLVFRFYKEIKAPWPIIAMTLPYICLFFIFRFYHVRPELFDNLLVMATMILYVRAKDSFSNKHLIYIALLQLFWVNYHAAILGYIILFGLFIDKAIELFNQHEIKDKALNWGRWLGWGIIIFLVGFLNSNLEHPLYTVLSLSNEWSLTAELRPTSEFLPNSSFFNFFWLVSAYLVISLLAQKQWGFAFICALFAFKSWEMIRLVPTAGIVISSLMAISLNKINFKEFLLETKKSIKFLILGLGLIVTLTGTFLTAIDARTVHNLSNKEQFPNAIVPYLKDKHPEGGRVFNSLRYGGFLLYHLSPNFKVYIDGRINILYPLDFTKNYVRINNLKSSELLAQEIDRYDIQFVILPIKADMFSFANDSKRLFVEFVGENFILYSTKDNNFPISTRHMFYPMCWTNTQSSTASGEVTKAKEILSDDSALLPILKHLDKLKNSNNPEDFFEALDIEGIDSFYQQRLLAYIALKSGLNDKALEIFTAIQLKNSLDLLMMSYAYLNNKDFEKAEKLLILSTSESWSLYKKEDLSTDEKAIALALFDRLKSEHSLSNENDQRYKAFKQDLLQKNPRIKIPSTIIPQNNCPSLTSDIPSYLLRHQQLESYTP